MPIRNVTDAQFETEFADFEKNRMYPIGYRKESSMTKLTLKHVSAISHAEVYIRPAIKQGMSPHHRKCIESDLERLAEIKRWLLVAIYEPGLPIKPEIAEEPKPHGDTGD